MHNLQPLKADLHIPDGTTATITHLGDVQLASDLILHEVLCVPTFTPNLISIAKLTVNPQSSLLFSSTNCILQDHTLKREREIGRLQNGLYKLHAPNLNKPPDASVAGQISVGQSCIAQTVSKISDNIVYNSVTLNSTQLWHSRLGHPSTFILNKVPLVTPNSVTFDACDICHYFKQHRLAFPHSTFQSTCVFELIHLDVWGPYRQATHNNYSYFLTVVDDFSKATWVFLFTYKSQVPALIKNFIFYVHNQFKTSVQTVRSDNGTEFTNADLQDFF